MRAVLGAGRDPLYLFLLATLSGCAGRSGSNDDVGEHGGGSGTGGSAGLTPVVGQAGAGAPAGGRSGAGGMPPIVERGGQGGRAPSTGGAGDSSGGKAPLLGGMGGVAPAAPEGIVGCDSPAPYQGEQSGLVSCDGGVFVHRSSAGTCDPTPFKEVRYEGRVPGANGCAGDAECEQMANGRCYMQSAPLTKCISACESDRDCGNDEVCLCDPDVNHCVQAKCHTDDDCGPDLLCTNLKQACGNDIGIFLCQAEGDACTATCPGGACILMQVGGQSSRVCSLGAGGSCGRPFLIHGEAELAPPRERSDWLDKAAPELDVGALSPELRRRVAARWRDIALMEHASIGAFARFTLELLALGAPSSLVREATEAMADEERHARLCFSLASAYAGSPVGPGPLAVEGALERVELERVAVTTFLEGCIGETVAAVEARELARHARDPHLARSLSTIATDESRHSALAWRFLRWALERGGERLALALEAALEGELSTFSSVPVPDADRVDEAALAHGFLPAAERRALRADVLREIVLPCLSALRPAAFAPVHAGG